MAEKPIIFVSYSHRDEGSKDQLLPHIRMLEELGTLTMWDDREIGVGDAWFEEITDKLDRCRVAVLLVSADILASQFGMRDEVPPLLERRRRDGMLIVPILIQPCLWDAVAWLRAIQLLPRDGVAIAELTRAKRNRAFTEVARAINAFLQKGQEEAFEQGTAWPEPDAIDIDRLPTSGYDLVGRGDELKLLDDIWDKGEKNVVSLVAWGGVGKSTLVNKWCEYLSGENYRGARRVFAWSFYSQGTNERVTSADQFIAEALVFFGDPDPIAGSPWARGERLADLVRREKTLLILDGLEPLQDSYQGIKDPGVQRLVEELARDNAGLCVITTREPVKELSDFSETTLERNLEQISAAAGRALLRIKGVRGSDGELEQASREFGNHALAITLLANYLLGIEGHHIREAAAIPDLDLSDEKGRHPRRVMEAFARRFGDGPALELLFLLGLFDRPATGDCIDALKATPAIPGLTEHLVALSDADWLGLLEELRDLGLVAAKSHHAPDELDAHPLVREHFGARLREERPAAWRAGHGRLYEHLKTSAKDLPDTLAEMAPLFQAMHHGCQAGRHQEALDEVYVHRIKRGRLFYVWTRLGAFGADLATLSGLFDPPFQTPVATLTEAFQGLILNDAAYDLRALGRLREAVAPMRAALERPVANKNWWNAAQAAANHSKLLLTLGDVAEAVAMGKVSVEYAERSEDAFQCSSRRTTWADALHQGGDPAHAQVLFEEAERLQAEFEPQYPRLYSLGGYHYCDLLLAEGRAAEVRMRAQQFFEWRVPSDSLLDIALDHLSLGRAALALGEHGDARTQLDQAVDGLRQAGQMDDLPRGLLARAALFREIGPPDLCRAERDLDEAMRIARRGEMRLHQCDAQLEYARLALAKGDPDQAREPVVEARRLVDETGYGRRRPEIEELVAAVGLPAPPATC